MDQLDQLIQYQLRYANALGEDKVKEIEADVNLFADADQFRIYHAKGRFRGTISAFLITGAAFGVMSGGRGGYAKMWQNPLAVGVFGASWLVCYKFWSYYAGYTNQKYNEF